MADKINLVLDVLKINETFGREYEDSRVKVDLTYYSSSEPHYKLSIIIKPENRMNTDYASFTGAKIKLLDGATIQKIFDDLKK